MKKKKRLTNRNNRKIAGNLRADSRSMNNVCFFFLLFFAILKMEMQMQA